MKYITLGIYASFILGILIGHIFQGDSIESLIICNILTLIIFMYHFSFTGGFVDGK